MTKNIATEPIAYSGNNSVHYGIETFALRASTMNETTVAMKKNYP